MNKKRGQKASAFVLVALAMGPGLSRGPGVEVERAVPEVWCSSRSASRSGEGVAELKSKRRGRRGAEVPWRSSSQWTHAESLSFLYGVCSKKMLKLELE